MPNILVVHASDAEPVLERFRSALDAGPISFLNVEDASNTEELRFRFLEKSKDNNICLLLSSDLLARLLRPLSRRQETLRSQYLLSERITLTFFLSLTRPFRDELALWQELFDPVIFVPGEPLLRMPPDELNEFIRTFGRLLREPPLAGRRLPERFEPEFEDSERLQFRIDRLHEAPIVDPRVVELLFATNRVPENNSPVTDFTGERANALSFGACRVRVPDDHKIGQLELPNKTSWIRLRFRDEEVDEARHFVIQGVSAFDQKQFLDIVQRDPSETALIFVHGFNTSFKDGVLRFAQIIWDMQFKGAPILFSWPSATGVLDYVYDLNSALVARQWFQKLIQMLRVEAKVQTIHIIAHSMGNLVVLEALSELAKARTLPNLSEIVMAAPDVDVDHYKTLAPNIRPWVRGMTLYASANDKALVISRGLAKKPRAGDVFKGSPILLPNIESIDVSAIGDEMFGLNHNVFASNRSLIDDIGRLVLSGARPPDQRSPQIRCVPEGMIPPHYWRYAP
jgi:esterase/lipase superfamily enzyme